MICPHCGKETTAPTKVQKNKDIYALFLSKWNEQEIVKHKKVTTIMKKTIDKITKNDDYTYLEIFIAFKNYATILKSPQYSWTYQWTMADFLNRGLHKFVDEARPFGNSLIDNKPKNPFANFSCGGD